MEFGLWQTYDIVLKTLHVSTWMKKGHKNNSKRRMGTGEGGEGEQSEGA